MSTTAAVAPPSPTAPTPPAAAGTAGKKTVFSVPTMAMLTAAAIVTSLRGLPLMAEEELTMFAYIAFATILFLLPAALVSAELGGALADRKGGVYAWVGEAFGQRWGFVAVWLQWIQNVVWYPTALGFAAAAAAFAVHRSGAADNNVYVGLFCIGAYWLATLVALRGNTFLAKITKYGFIAGTVLPGILLLVLFGYWAISGHPIGWAHTHAAAVTQTVHGHASPRWFPHVAGLGTLSFLAAILLLFAGVEVQAVHATDMKDARRGFPKAIFLAAWVCFAVFTLGALAVAGILPYQDITLQSGVFDAFKAPLSALGVEWVAPIIAALVCYGALGGALAWISGPSRALLAPAEDGALPLFLQRTNPRGAQRNILLVQGVIVTAISGIYLVMKDVSSAFFLISALVVGLYIIMYMLMFAAAIRLRYTQPDLPRQFRIPGGVAGMWAVAGVGFAAVSFALVLAFVPPAQLPIGNPASYVALVAGGTIVFTGLPLLIYRLRRPGWKKPTPATAATPATATPSESSAAAASRAAAISVPGGTHRPVTH